jgi:hypothetical protein
MRKLYPAAHALLKCIVMFVIATVFTGINTTSAQNIANYAFSTGATGSLALDMNGNAIDMTTGTTLLLGPSIAGGTGTGLVNLPFDYWMMGTRNTQFSVTTNGWLGIGVALTGTGNGWLGGASLRVAPLLGNLTGGGFDIGMATSSTGKIHYKTVGTAPNRTMVIEYLNMTLSSTAATTSPDATFQARIYESTGALEFIYGSVQVSGTGNIVGTVGFQSNTTIFNCVNYNTQTASTVTSTTPSLAPGTVTALNSLADGSRRYYRFVPAGANTPTNLTFTSVTPVGMTLNWTDNATDELGYAVFRSADGGATWNWLTTTAASAITYASTGLNPNTTYNWRVAAVRESLGTALTGSQITSAPGNITSVATGNWSNPATWSSNAVPAAGDNVTIADGHTVTIDVAASAYSLTVGQGASGILQYEQTTARTLTVGGDVTVAAGGTLRSNAAGTVTTHGLSVGGNLNNNGTIDFSTNSNTAGTQITFTGSLSATWASGASSTTNLRNTTGVTLNKGTSIASTLTFTPNGTLTVQGANTTGFLTITNGLFVLGGANVFSNPVFNAVAYTIAATGGFQLNNINATIVGLNGSPINNGLLKISAGIFNIGTTANNAMTGAAGQYVIEGGILNIAGRLTSSGAGIYTQTGGVVNVTTVTAGNTTSSAGGLDFSSTTSTVNISGGTINLVTASTAATTPLDYRFASTTVNITGGTLNVGTAATATNFTFRLSGALPSVVIDNTTNNKTANLFAASAAYGAVTVNTGTTLNANGFVLTLRNTITNTGTVTANTTGSGLTFLGSVAQTLGGTITSNQIVNVTVNNTAGVIITPSVQVNTALTLTAGSLSSGGTLTLGNGSTNSFTYIRTNGTTSGTVAINYGTGTNNFTYNGISAQTTGIELPATVATGTLTINNTAGVTLNSSLSIQILALTSGVLSTSNSNLITVTGTTTGSVTGGSATAYVNGPLARTLPASLVSGSTYTWPIGKSAYKLLELINPTTSAAGTIVVKAEVFDTDPTGTYTGFSGLTNNRYWQLILSGAGAFTATGQLRITETGLGGSSKIAQSVAASATGTYSSVGGFVAGSSIASTSTLTAFGTGGNSTYFVVGNANPFTAGKYSIGPLGSYVAPQAPAYVGTFTSLTQALTAASSAGVPTDHLIFELQNDYNPTVETYPISVTFQGNSAATLTMRPRSDAGATIFTFTTAGTSTFDLNTADYVTIEGRPGGSGSAKNISIINTSTTGVAVRLVNDATFNTVQYCDIQGANTSTTASGTTGVVYVSTGLTVGNDNFTLSNCDIHSNGGNLTYGVVVYGSTTTDNIYNDNGTITNCKIYDMFSAGSATTGIKLDVGTNAWNITNNSIYQTAPRTYTTANTHRGIWVTPNTGTISTTASGFTITGNYIGGSDVQTGGTPMTLSGAVASAFWGMDISVGFGTATSIQNNKVSNIALTTTTGAFYGISQNTGNVSIGNLTGNTVGDPTLTGAITYTTTATGGGTVFGYRTLGGAGAVLNVANNIFAGITTIGSATLGANITGVSIEGTTTATVNVTGNTIGNGDIVNSLNASSSTTGAQSVRGINIASTGAGTISVNNNTVINLNNNYNSTSTAALTQGIVVASSATPVISSITNNKVRNLSSASSATGTGASSAVGGILVSNTNAAGVTVSQNTIDSLFLTSVSTTAAINATGLFLSVGSTVASTISRNFIHTIELTAANPNSVITGIDYGGGTSNVINNMIRIGVKADGTDLTTPVLFRGITANSSATTLNHNFWFNTIYIGGQNVAANTPAKNSYAFIKQGTAAGTYDIRNNILVNNRSNSSNNPVVSPPNGHYALYLGSATGNTVNYNVYQATGTDGYIGYNGSSAITTYASNWISGDINSSASDPLFVNPTGDITTLNLHISLGSPAESNGVLIGSVTDDFDGQTRASLSPTDIGADAGSYQFTGIDVGVTGFVSPAATGCYSATQTITVTLKNFSANPIDFSVNNATVSVTGTLPGGGPYSGNKLLNTGILASGATMSVDMTATANMSLSGVYSFNSTVTVTGDVNTANNAANPITRAVLGGTLTVGASGNYPTLTAAITDYNNASCITGPVTFTLIDPTYDGTTEGFPIIINANLAAGTNMLTIKPASGNSPTITGAVASGALIRVNGADYVTIDGSNNGTTTNDLTINNTSATAPSGIALISLGTGAGATNVTIKNCNITTATNLASYGIAIGGATPGSAGADNDNVTIQNNIITDASNGIYAIGTVAGLLDNLVITKNSHTTLTTVTAIASIRAGQATGATISQNTVTLETSGSTAPVGISLETGFVSSSVTRNNITKVKTTATGGYGGRGICIGTGTASSNLTIANNMITGVNGSNWTSFTNSSAVGILIGEIGSGTSLTTTAGGINIYYNSINLSGDYSFAGACLTGAIYIGSAASALDVRNNIFVNSLNNINATGTASKNYAIYSAAPNTAFSSINYNDYYVSGTQGVLGFIVSDRTTLADIVTGFGQNTNAKNEDPTFVSASDLHLQPASTLDGQGTPIGAVTIDYDGETRDAVNSDIGADELPAAVGIDMKPFALLSPAISAAGCYNTETITVTIKNNSTTTINLAGSPVTVSVNVTGAVTATYSKVVNTGTLAAGANLNVTMATPGSTINMSTAGAYSFDITTAVTGDVNTSNDLLNETRTKQAVSAGTISSTPTNYCGTGGTPQLSTTGAAGYSGLQWQESTTSGSGFSNIGGATTNPYTVGSAITQTMYYKLVATCGVTTDVAAEISVVLNNPQITGTTPGSRCGPGTVNLSATTNPGGSINWYAASSGGTSLYNGTSFTTPVINSTTTFYAAASDGGSSNLNVGRVSSSGADGNYNGTTTGLVFSALSGFTLNSVQVYPVGSGAGSITIALKNSAGTVLNSATVAVTGTAAPGILTTVPLNFPVVTGTDYRLELTAISGLTGLTRDFTGVTFPYTLSGVASITGGWISGASTTYYFFYNWTVSTGCEGTRTPVAATINTAPALSTPTATPAAICEGQSTQLLVGSSNAGYVYTWSSGAGTGVSVNVSPTLTTKYYVDAADNSGGTFNGCTNRDSVTVTVNPVPSPVNITPVSATICPGSVAELLTATGGTLASSIQIGTGNTQNATNATLNMPPYGNYYTGNRHQILVLASELTAAGLTAGKAINSLAFDVLSNTNALGYNGFTIKLGHTPATALTTTFLTSSTTTVYTATNFSPTTGWSTHNFSIPFVWDGTSNVLVETYFSNCGITGASSCSGGTTCTGTGSGVTYTLNAVTNQSATAFVSHVFYYSDGAACLPETQTTATSAVSVRPNMLIGFDNPTTMTWSPTTGLFTDASATVSYSGGAATAVYAKPASTSTYTATSTTAASCTSSSNVVITYNTAVTNSTTLAGATGGSQVCANYSVSTSNNYFDNCNIIATVAPSGGNAVSGNINTCVKIDATVQTAPGGEAYVQRHFNITPASNPGTATSTITLYFLQSEFTAFNAANGTYPDLPTNGSDATGKANLRITQYNGIGTAPGNYTGSAVQINPADASIVYNSTAGRWEVTFDATGSGGFYVHTGNFVLPVTLVNFKGERIGAINKLSWQTETEANNSGFELQRSADGINFSKLSFVATKADNGYSNTTLSYSYNDENPLRGNNYYRLKQVDKDGKYSYSTVVLLRSKATEITLSSVYPNPAQNELNLVITSPSSEKVTIVVTDLSGKVIMQQAAQLVIGDNQQQLKVQSLASGTYIIKAVCSSGCETAVHRFVKQ